MNGLSERIFSASALPKSLRTLALCAALLLLFAQAGRAQMAYAPLPASDQNDGSDEEKSALYAGSALGASASAVVGYRFGEHLTANLATGQFLFADDDQIKPGLGVNYARMLPGSNWGVEVRGFAHFGLGTGLFPGAQAGVFRRTKLTERFMLFPQLSVFTYGAGIGSGSDLFRRRWLRDHAHAGVMLEAPVAFELTESKFLVATPMLRFQQSGFARDRFGFGLTLGYDW